MSFQPVIQALRVPRISTSIYFKDITGTYPTADKGYGAANAPANQAAITSVWGEIQPYGNAPIQSTNTAGTLADEVALTVIVPDGVNILHTYYGEYIPFNFTVSADRMTLTSPDNLTNLLDSVAALSISDIFPAKIDTVVGSTIHLQAPLDGTLTSGNHLYRFFHAQVYTLVLNCGESQIVNAIAKLPVTINPCEAADCIVNWIMLKLGSEIAFTDGNYSKAHEAATLICGSNNLNCKSCG